MSLKDQRLALELIKIIPEEIKEFIEIKLDHQEPLILNEIFDPSRISPTVINITCHRGIQTKYSSPIDFILT